MRSLPHLVCLGRLFAPEVPHLSGYSNCCPPSSQVASSARLPPGSIYEARVLAEAEVALDADRLSETVGLHLRVVETEEVGP